VSSLRSIVVLALGLVLLSGCRMVATVDVRVAEGGSGTVTVGAGFDADALARLGDPATELRLDDLGAAGWDVAEPAQEGDLTWIRAEKPFSDEAGLQQALDEVAGQGVLPDWTLSEESSLWSTDWRLDGTVDVTGGVERFSDPALVESLGGEPFGGLDTAVELETGIPVEEQVEVIVTAELPDGTAGVWEPLLGSVEPSSVALEASRPTTVARWWFVPVAIVTLVVGLLVLRAGFRRRHRRR
jgi:hypothetical protein